MKTYTLILTDEGGTIISNESDLTGEDANKKISAAAERSAAFTGENAILFEGAPIPVQVNRAPSIVLGASKPSGYRVKGKKGDKGKQPVEAAPHGLTKSGEPKKRPGRKPQPPATTIPSGGAEAGAAS